MSDVTRLLDAIEEGDEKATNELLPLVYDELRRLAAWRLSLESPGQTLQATALVHEAYLRLVGQKPHNWNSRGHFFVAAAEAMRRILIERARSRQRRKRGGNRQRVELDEAMLQVDAPSDAIIALDEALHKLALENEDIATTVKLKYFAGMSLDQIAGVLGVSRRTVSSYWAFARAWLYREIRRGDTQLPVPDL
jgi:RNA polymerase sigma factor (TIGR02999 family)